MLAGIETPARLICEVMPYISSFGKDRVEEYTIPTKAIDLCQTIRSR